MEPDPQWGRTSDRGRKHEPHVGQLFRQLPQTAAGLGLGRCLWESAARLAELVEVASGVGGRQKYWSRYNPAYPDYNAAGGDCTNFVSQSLKAGGWKAVTGSSSDFHKWFSNSTAQLDSWLSVNELSWFALSSKRVTSLANVYQLDVGDVLQMDFDKDGSKDHSMIVTYRSSQGVPYLTYHSANTYRRSVASIIASEPNALYYAYRT